MQKMWKKNLKCLAWPWPLRPYNIVTLSKGGLADQECVIPEEHLGGQAQCSELMDAFATRKLHTGESHGEMEGLRGFLFHSSTGYTQTTSQRWLSHALSKLSFGKHWHQLFQHFVGLTASYHADHSQPFCTALLFLDAFSISVIWNNWTLQAGTTSFFQSGNQSACFGHHHNWDSNHMNSVPGTKSRRPVVFDPPDSCSELQGKIKMQPTSSARKFLPDPRLATERTQDTSQSCICFLHYSNLSNKNIFQIHNGQ